MLKNGSFHQYANEKNNLNKSWNDHDSAPNYKMDIISRTQLLFA